MKDNGVFHGVTSELTLIEGSESIRVDKLTEEERLRKHRRSKDVGGQNQH